MHKLMNNGIKIESDEENHILCLEIKDDSKIKITDLVNLLISLRFSGLGIDSEVRIDEKDVFVKIYRMTKDVLMKYQI